MNSFDAGVRRRLYLARVAAKLTQQEAAAAIGTSRQKLARCERGDSSPTLEEFKELCVLYGVTPSYILFGADVAKAIRSAMAYASAEVPGRAA